MRVTGRERLVGPRVTHPHRSSAWQQYGNSTATVRRKKGQRRDHPCGLPLGLFHSAGATGSLARRDNSMVFQSFRPGPALSRFVQSFWLYQTGPRPFARSRGLPTGTAQIVIDLRGDGPPVHAATPAGSAPLVARALFNGADTRYILNAGGGSPAHYMGVDFTPGGAYPFVGPPAGELRDAHLPLETLWGRCAVDDLCERLLRAQTPAARCQILEAVLLAQLARPLDHHPAVTLALRAFAAAPRRPVIAQIADQLALSHARFIAVFRDEVGLSPKQYCRVRRFVRVLERINPAERPDWAQLALEYGYYDQAHLCHDFQQFAGVSPSVYIRDRSADTPTYLTLANGDTPGDEAPYRRPSCSASA
jgi:methylphosphotriester-DNA--protein-cysteine methyltransferase